MHLRTFSAGSMAEALMQVKTELGADAVILHTRTYRQKHWMGLRRREVVEVTAGTGVNVQSRAARREQSPQRDTLPRRSAALAGAPGGRAAIAPVQEAPPTNPRANAQQLLQTPVANSAALVSLSQEMGTLRSMVFDLVKESRASRAPQVPEDLFDHYTHLIQNQVADELARDILKQLQATMRPDHLKNSAFVREKIVEQLEKLLPVSGPITRTKRIGPHVVALIGPTGVGKTTTIAKLAANLRIRENKRVGLITIDTYRIAAVDQLRKYADIIGSPLKVVTTPDDLRDAVASMGDCDYVLIDTAGRSPTDSMRLAELKNFLTLANPDEVHLVLSSTASESCIEKAVARFSEVRVDKIIFTKLDEAVSVGVVFNVIRKVNKSLSYVTTGQDVPDDIDCAHGNKLARLIIGGVQ